MPDLVLRRSSWPPTLAARSQVGDRISLSESDRDSRLFTARSGVAGTAGSLRLELTKAQ